MVPYDHDEFSLAKFFDADLLKDEHDTFDVYVNEEYIGKKTLLTEAEEIDDVANYLKKQGLTQISTNLNGDHYVIKTEEGERVKQIIEAYLNIR